MEKLTPRERERINNYIKKNSPCYPFYCYFEEKVFSQVKKLRKALQKIPHRILYAMKANSNPGILLLLRDLVDGVDAVSCQEIRLAQDIGYSKEEILFTGSYLNDHEIDFAFREGILINVDSLEILERVGEKYPGLPICLRINPNVGAGHHNHCITGGPLSKFGISYKEIEKIKKIAQKYSLKIIGLHQHIGSGILKTEKFLLAMDILLGMVLEFPDLEFIDFGGGFGIPYHPEDQPFNLSLFAGGVEERYFEFIERYKKIYRKEPKFVFEPGRFIIGEAGFLVVEVTSIKKSPEGRIFVGVNSGFNHLIRPAMYGSYHEIINLSNPSGEKIKVDICGNICESSDFFARDREINQPKRGDHLAICDAGAYGFSMSMLAYNMRQPPREVIFHQDGRESVFQWEIYQKFPIDLSNKKK